MNTQIRKSIGLWKGIGSNQTDIFTKFFMFYMCLDAWMTTESGEDSDTKKLNWLVNSNNALKTHWDGVKNGKQFQSWLNGLKQVGTVSDKRPRNPGSPKVLDDTSDFKQVICFMYQIRCNLFHGSKSPADENDRVLVGCSAKILEKWILWTYEKTR